MGSFSGFLQGLAGGAAETYTKQANEARERKLRNDSLVADSLMEQLKSRDDLTPEEQTHLLTEGLKLRGMDKKSIEPIVNASGYFRNMLSEQDRLKKAAAPKPVAPAVAPQAVDPFKMPGMQGPASSEAGSPFGDVPVFTSEVTAKAYPDRMRTARELNQEINLPLDAERAAALEKAKHAALIGDVRSKIAIMQEYTGTSLEDEVRQMLGMAAKAGGSATYLPGVMSGKDLLTKYPQLAQTKGVNPNSQYRISVGADKTTPVDFFPVMGETVTSKSMAGYNVKGQFAKDQMGNPIVDNAMYTPIRNRLGGDIVGVIPETELGTITNRTDIKVVTQADGSQELVMTPTSSTSQKVVPGSPFGNVPSLPVQPGAVSTPSGQAPTALGGVAPATSAPPPTRVAAQAGTGQSGRKVVGMKPLSTEEFRSVNTAKEALNKMNDLLRMIDEDPNIVLKAKVPYAGDVIAPTFNRYTKELADLVTRVRTGAALNANEEEFYNNQLPRAADVLSQAWNFDQDAVRNAVELHRDYFKRVMDQYEPRMVKPKGSLGDVPSRPAPGKPVDKRPSLDDIFGTGKKK